MVIQSQQDRRLPTIQSLRGIAAILVVLDHFARIVNDGHSWIYERIGNLGVSGVDIFFVISGFIMVYTTKNKTGPGKALTFIRKRIVRIYPLYWVWTSVMVFLWISGMAKLGGRDHHLQYSTLYIVNSYLLIPSFNGENFNPFLAQGWTLSFEMFFYIVFSCSIALGLTSRRLLFLAGTFLALAVVGTLLGGNSGVRYLFANSILIEFLYGVLAAELLGRFGPRLGQTRFSRLSSLCMTAGGIALLCTSPMQVSDSWRFLLYGIPAMFLVFGAAAAGTRPVPRLLAYLGDSSYSIYLVHGLFVFLYASKLRHFTLVNRLPPDLTILIGVAVAVTCSSFTYSLVERPLTRLLSAESRSFRGLETPSANL